MSRRWALLLILLVLPPVAAHGETHDEHATTPVERSDPRDVEVPAGYTGPGREPYMSYFEGVWLYGQMASTPLGAQRPASMDVDGDWVVWEDKARADIYAHNIPSGQGFYITGDAYLQRNPRISDGVVVFEDYRHLNRPSIYAYFLDTGETRRLSNRTTVVREPTIDYPIVAWLDENVTNPDVWAYSLLNNTAWNLHDGTDRDSNPVVVNERVFWRTYRYNLWDIVGYDTRTGELLQVTTDSAIQSAPFTNGKDLLYLTNFYDLGWSLERYDLDEQASRATTIKLPDSSRNSADGEGLLRVSWDVDYAELVIRNLTTGTSNRVSGDLLLATDPVLQGRTIFAILQTKTGTSLLQLDVSPFAFAKRPTLIISNPAQNTPWLRPLVVSGLLEAGPEFTEPTTFTYRIDDNPPQVVPPGARWRFTIDPQGVEPGAHVVTVRATFREGPPVTASVLLSVPAPSESIDVERAGPAFHAARLLSELNAYVLDNPASWVLIPLVLLILALLSLRVWLWAKPRRQRQAVEYVAPDEA